MYIRSSTDIKARKTRYKRWSLWRRSSFVLCRWEQFADVRAEVTERPVPQLPLSRSSLHSTTFITKTALFCVIAQRVVTNNFLQTFRDNLSVPSSRFKNWGFLNPENGTFKNLVTLNSECATYTFLRNVDKKLSLLAV
jgi:hypothetical protein